MNTISGEKKIQQQVTITPQACIVKMSTYVDKSVYKCEKLGISIKIMILRNVIKTTC